MANTNKIGIFGVLLFATMMMVIPASLADIHASEKRDRYYDKDRYYEDDRYYDDKRGYDNKDYSSERHYIEDDYYDDSYKKKPAIVEIKKELFVCDNIVNVTEENSQFNCTFSENIGFPAPPDSDQYVSCDMIDGGCPGIDESDFAVQVWKDVAVARDLSSTIPTPVDLEKINFYLTEDEPEDNVNNDGNQCAAVGFAHSLSYQKVVSEDLIVFYDMCMLFEGECDGPIHPGQVKECTVKNFIHFGNFNFIEDEPNG